MPTVPWWWNTWRFTISWAWWRLFTLGRRNFRRMRMQFCNFASYKNYSTVGGCAWVPSASGCPAFLFFPCSESSLVSFARGGGRLAPPPLPHSSDRWRSLKGRNSIRVVDTYGDEPFSSPETLCYLIRCSIPKGVKATGVRNSETPRQVIGAATAPSIDKLS